MKTPHHPPLRHDDVTKWKHFPCNWSFVRGIHQSPVNSPHKGQWRGASMFSLICVWINDWVNNREAGDLRRHLDHYDVSVMKEMCRWTVRKKARNVESVSISWRHQCISYVASSSFFFSNSFGLINILSIKPMFVDTGELQTFPSFSEITVIYTLK